MTISPHAFRNTAAIAICFILLSLDGHAANLPSRIVVSSGTHNLVESIEYIAINNHIPLGVIKPDAMCGIKFSIDKSEVVSTTEFIRHVNEKITPYAITVQDGVMILGPISLDKSMESLLALTIPYFRPEDTTMSGLGQYLWMYVRAAVRPDQASMISILSNPNSDTINGFSVESPRTVLQLLDEIVQQHAKGMWVVSGIDNDWKEHMNSDPIKIFAYEIGTQQRPTSVCRQ